LVPQTGIRTLDLRITKQIIMPCPEDRMLFEIGAIALENDVCPDV
jgi:hypothetical protein